MMNATDAARTTSPASSHRLRELAGKAGRFFPTPLLALILFCAATLILFGRYDDTIVLRTYQDRFGPALALACKGELGVITFEKLPQPQIEAAAAKMNAFLKEIGPARSFDCGDWPTEAKVSGFDAESDHLRFFHRYQYYFLGVVGIIWKIAGPSWAAVEFLTAMFGGGFLVGLFLVARRFIPALPAAILAAWVFAVDTVNIQMLIVTREYGKTLFITYAFLLLMWLVTGRGNRGGKIAGAAGLGALLGFGYGFRQDMVAATLIAATILLVLGSRWDRTADRPGGAVAQRLAPIAAMLLAFAALAAVPYIAVPVDHGHEGHFLILGLSDSSFDYAGWALGETSYNPSYADASAYALIESYVIATTGVETTQIFSEAYNTLSVWQLVDYAMTFSHDVVGRVAATLTIILGLRDVAGLCLFAAASFSLYFWRPRLLAMIGLYFCLSAAVLSLQFQPRHYFYAPMLARTVMIAIVISVVLRVLLAVIGGTAANPFALARSRLAEIWRTEPKLVVFAPVILPAACILVFLATSKLQQTTEGHWLSTVERQARVPVEGMEVYSGADTDNAFVARFAGVATFVDFRGQDMAVARAVTLPMTGGYIEALFDGTKGCPLDNIYFSVAYDSYNPAVEPNFNRTIELDRSGKTRYIMPIFYSQYLRPEAINFSTFDKRCVPTFSWIKNFPEIRLPVFVRVGANTITP